MKLFGLLTLVLSAFYMQFVRCDFLQFMNECTTHCKRVHTKFGNIKFLESNPITTRHTAEDIGLTSCLQRCRLAEVVRPKDSLEIGKI